MNLTELKAALERQGLPSRRYSLSGGSPNGGFGLDHEGDTWTVYYSERGQRCYIIESYDTEDAACRRLWDLATGGRRLPGGTD
ncbi:hypothetical protein [Micromonospora sp. DT47]|uniref:hypothetical protein n=1 Tax=Micromonospora sp. DT47 TaxID=3393431 RepID=UPI003CF4D3F8